VPQATFGCGRVSIRSRVAARTGRRRQSAPAVQLAFRNARVGRLQKLRNPAQAARSRTPWSKPHRSAVLHRRFTVSAMRLHSLLTTAAGKFDTSLPRAEGLDVEFNERECLIGKHGPQSLLAIASWQDGEEELVVTRFRECDFDYVLVYRFEYDRSSLTSHQALGVLDLEQADWVATALRVHLGEHARQRGDHSVLDMDAHRGPPTRVTRSRTADGQQRMPLTTPTVGHGQSSRTATSPSNRAAIHGASAALARAVACARAGMSCPAHNWQSLQARPTHMSSVQRPDAQASPS
jgi:hypothetical protein